MKHLAVAVAEVLQVADILVFGEQLVEVLARLAVFEFVILQLAQRLGEPLRQIGELLHLVLHPGLALRPPRLQRVALAIEDVLQALLHLGERVLEVEVAVALADLLAQLLQELVQAHHAVAVDIEALAGQPVDRLAHVVGVGQILGQLLQHLVGVKPDALGAVPLRIAYDRHRPNLR